jgi:nucleotide-binding universal stress UspA family protein
MSKILCPVDFSDPSRAALEAAADAAKERGATLVLAHAIDMARYAVTDGFYAISSDLIQSVQKGAEEAMARWKAEAEKRGAPAVETRILEGPAWDAVTRLAREGGFRLIVIGTHGRTGLKHALIGSVAEKVVRHAPCSVLVVRSAA